MKKVSPLRLATQSKPRISAKLRHAIDLRVRKALTIAEACEEAGVSQSGWFAAMKRPAVQNALSEAQERFVKEAEALRATAKAAAIEVAIDLMKNAKSENVRARMAEFLLTEGKGAATQIAVNVDARSVPVAGGYEYAPYGREIETVEVAPHDDPAKQGVG